MIGFQYNEQPSSRRGSPGASGGPVELPEGRDDLGDRGRGEALEGGPGRALVLGVVEEDGLGHVVVHRRVVVELGAVGGHRQGQVNAEQVEVVLGRLHVVLGQAHVAVLLRGGAGHGQEVQVPVGIKKVQTMRWMHAWVRR